MFNAGDMVVFKKDTSKWSSNCNCEACKDLRKGVPLEVHSVYDTYVIVKPKSGTYADVLTEDIELEPIKPLWEI